MEDKSLYIKKNVGPIGQIARSILGLLLVIIPPFLNLAIWSIVILAAIGGALIFEGIIAY